MPRVVLMRHGETEWNEGQYERFRGRADVDLDHVSIKQSRLTAD